MDRPTPQMFQMLKAKQAADYIPLLQISEGKIAQLEEENKGWIFQHFKQPFSDNNVKSDKQKDSIEKIKMIRRKVLSNEQEETLNRNITKEELYQAIDLLKDKKLPGKDGPPIEFFKTFKDILLQPMLEV